MTKIAFLGLGAMGSRMAGKLLAAGNEVTAWNRNLTATKELVAAGAVAADSPRAAVLDADLVISMVRDDDASQTVWLDPEKGALSALKAEAIGVECSTVSLPHIRRLATAFKEAYRNLLDAPLAGSRPQAEAGQLIFFVGGEDDIVEKANPLLLQMGSAVHHAGSVGAGTAVKLMVNSLFGTQLAVMAELLGFAQNAGLDPALAAHIISQTPVCSPAVKGSAEAMLAQAFAPAFPIDLVAKDFGLVQRSANELEASVPLSGAAGQVFEKGVSSGFGSDNITGIIQLYR